MSSRPECPDCGERSCNGKPDGSGGGQGRTEEPEKRYDFRKLVTQEDNGMIRPEIKALAERGNITLEEWSQLRTNSWEHELLVPRLNNEALVHVTEHFVRNCMLGGRRPFTTYNDAVCGLIVPELVRRLGVGISE